MQAIFWLKFSAFRLSCISWYLTTSWCMVCGALRCHPRDPGPIKGEISILTIFHIVTSRVIWAKFEKNRLDKIHSSKTFQIFCCENLPCVHTTGKTGKQYTFSPYRLEKLGEKNGPMVQIFLKSIKCTFKIKYVAFCWFVDNYVVKFLCW